jgi:formylglycine-generating enzyme required for sulfatase activity
MNIKLHSFPFLLGLILTFNVNAQSGIEIEMVSVEGGKFMMGSNEGEEFNRPAHEVSVQAFKIGKYEVTQLQWRLVMGYDQSTFSNCDECPIETISWKEIQTFIKKLNLESGRKYRLPTESEWEFAAKGGIKSKGYTFSGGNNISEVAWYYENSDSTIHKVGLKQPNELGIYDMTGNVWEWCSDLASSYSNKNWKNEGSYRILKGGSWISEKDICFPWYREYDGPKCRRPSGGFRLTMDN